MTDEIEEYIRTQRGVVVVYLTDPFLQSRDETRRLIEQMRQWQEDIPVVRFDFSLHREWAGQYRVGGSPCALVFHDGQLRLRVRGRCDQSRLRKLLDTAGLLSEPPSPASSL